MHAVSLLVSVQHSLIELFILRHQDQADKPSKAALRGSFGLPLLRQHLTQEDSITCSCRQLKKATRRCARHCNTTSTIGHINGSRSWASEASDDKTGSGQVEDGASAKPKDMHSV